MIYKYLIKNLNEGVNFFRKRERKRVRFLKKERECERVLYLSERSEH